MKNILFLRIETLHRAFFKYIHWLHIAPKQDENISCGHYIKVIFCAVFVTIMFITGSLFKRQYLYDDSSKNVFGQYCQDLAEIISYIIVLRILWSYLNNDVWQFLYKKIEMLEFSSEKAIEYTPFIAILLGVFFVSNLLGVYILYHSIPLIDQKLNSSFKSLIVMVYPFLLFYYMLALMTLILILIEEIRLQIKGATEHLNTSSMDVQTTKVMFFKARSLAILVNVKFGYELLAVFAQWLIYIIALSLSIAISIKTSIYQQSEEEPFWEMVIFFAISTVCTSVSDFIFNSLETNSNVFTSS